MKLTIFFYLLFSSFLFGQIKEDSLFLPELDLDKVNLENLDNYRKKLNKNELNLSYSIKFSGVFHHKDNDSINFTGKAKYKKDLFLSNIYFNEKIRKEDKIILYKFFNQIYNLAYTYYSFSQDKNRILEYFYCIPKDNNQWNFKIHKKNTKEKLDTNTSNKMNFEILLDTNGIVQHIFTFSDIFHNFNRNGKVSFSHYIEIHLIAFDKTYMIKKINGNIINPSTKDKIKFDIIFT